MEEETTLKKWRFLGDTPIPEDLPKPGKTLHQTVKSAYDGKQP
ncbi:hypothetical protein T11_10420 [Trichinella zimbabwensis]|uniref:Uncharacterized protein n=1 Tax=Trichinella zimbabwensis TaxID=268475 RepID=A0A0V1GDS2_9BILA|nr:hypothetical protein T11_10420 [Trichinella zimbabwensis]